MNKNEFLKSELGRSMFECAQAWDNALETMHNTDFYSDEFRVEKRKSMCCQAQMSVYQIAVRQFYGIHYCFTRTDDYFGVCTEDESDWLFKVNRSSGSELLGQDETISDDTGISRSNSCDVCVNYAVVSMIDRSMQDDKRSKIQVAGLFPNPVTAEDYFIPYLPNKEVKRYLLRVEDLERFEEFYNFIQDLNEKYGEKAIFHLKDGGFTTDEENRFRQILDIWTSTEL